jgi:hypothetical protein
MKPYGTGEIMDPNVPTTLPVEELYLVNPELLAT